MLDWRSFPTKKKKNPLVMKDQVFIFLNQQWVLGHGYCSYTRNKRWLLLNLMPRVLKQITKEPQRKMETESQPTNPCCWEIITLKGTPGTEKICFDTDYRKLHHTSKFTHLSAHVSDNHKSTPSPHTHLQLPQKLKTVGLVLILHYVYN